MRHWALLLIFTGVLAGQGNAPHMNDWTPPAGETRLAPLGPCAALRQQTGFDFTILTATELTAGPGGAEYCRVLGMIQPEIRFEVNLPKAWNTRLLMTGNGGFAGEDLDAPQWAAMRHVAMEKGFVHTRSNTGHDARREPLGAFAVNPQKLYDYAFRSLRDGGNRQAPRQGLLRLSARAFLLHGLFHGRPPGPHARPALSRRL
jgi:hypothetical protein